MKALQKFEILGEVERSRKRERCHKKEFRYNRDISITSGHTPMAMIIYFIVRKTTSIFSSAISIM
jgi:hypothetical protein